MNRDELLRKLKEFRNETEKIQRVFLGIPGEFVSAQALKDSAASVSEKWFNQIKPALEYFEFPTETIVVYTKRVDSLLGLSLSRTSRKASFERVLGEIVSGFIADLQIPAYKLTDLHPLPESLEDILSTSTPEEREYLEESAGCIQGGHLRAAVILGWCAAIDRMQRTVQKLGLDEFNRKSSEMKSKGSPRYKRVGKVFSISTLSELRGTVFDNDLLWVLEYWGLIDQNQHDRLSACYVMRNTSAHPGDAKTSEENMASFFSDLKTCVFSNPSFKLV